jgi:hypothetical protein
MIQAPWCEWRDLNPQSYDYESTVLPLCYNFFYNTWSAVLAQWYSTKPLILRLRVPIFDNKTTVTQWPPI